MKHVKLILLLAIVCMLSLSAFAAEGDVYYLRDGGSGNGSSASLAGGSLADAYNALLDGGTVVVCGEYTIKSEFTSIPHCGKIIVTSVYGGVDYRTKNNARLVFSSNMYFSSYDSFMMTNTLHMLAKL